MSLPLAIHPFILVIIAYFIARFDEVLAFPFYRSWIFSKISKEKASSILLALLSYRRLIVLVTLALAGFLVPLKPILPYFASLILFISSSIIPPPTHTN